MFIFPSEEMETTKSATLPSRSEKEGLITHLSPTRPILTAAIGPFHGISEIIRAMEAAFIAKTSGSFFSSTDKMVVTIWVSFLTL